MKHTFCCYQHSTYLLKAAVLNFKFLLSPSTLASALYFTSIVSFWHTASRIPASRSAYNVKNCMANDIFILCQILFDHLRHISMACLIICTWATPISASRFTAAVWDLPRDSRYETSSCKSFIVKDNISTPIRPTSGAATSLTSAANCSRSLYTSSTVSVPRIARKCPSNVYMLIYPYTYMYQNYTLDGYRSGTDIEKRCYLNYCILNIFNWLPKKLFCCHSEDIFIFRHQFYLQQKLCVRWRIYVQNFNIWWRW